MKFKRRRTDQLSSQEREIVDRFERGAIDATEAGRLLIDSVNSVRPFPEAPVDENGHETDEIGATALDENPEQARARELVERIALETCTTIRPDCRERDRSPAM